MKTFISSFSVAFAACVFVLAIVDKPLLSAELSVSGTRFMLDGKPFSFTGVSFFNAIYNPSFNKDSATRRKWLGEFRDHGINVLRIWCQWDNGRGFVDASPAATLYDKDGSLRQKHLATIKDILADADTEGFVIELCFFSEESFKEGILLKPDLQDKAVAELTRELKPWRNVVFQIWNEHTDDHVLPLVKLIKSIDPNRLVTNSPGVSNVLGSDEENAALDFLTPHTARQSKGRHWEIAAQQVEGLLKKFNKPVVDDEPARNGTTKFGGPKEATSPFDHIVQIINVWKIGGYPIYHHDMFQTGYGTPACPPSGIPEPKFSSYHRVVFDFLAQRERYSPR